jgi:hypothetical protein
MFYQRYYLERGKHDEHMLQQSLSGFLVVPVLRTP